MDIIILLRGSSEIIYVKYLALHIHQVTVGLRNDVGMKMLQDPCPFL